MLISMNLLQDYFFIIYSYSTNAILQLIKLNYSNLSNSSKNLQI